MSLPLPRGTPIARTHVTVIGAPCGSLSRAAGLAVCSRGGAAGLSTAGEPLQVAQRVGGLPVDPDLEVHVWAEAVPGAVAEADDLPLGDLLP